MPADIPGKPRASPRAGAAGGAAPSSRRSKLEKADILELTVRHLQSLRRVQVTAALRSDPAILGKYRAGFHECLAEGPYLSWEAPLGKETGPGVDSLPGGTPPKSPDLVLYL
nr:PREDICTED: transcription factor HES-4 [Bos mutus]